MKKRYKIFICFLIIILLFLGFDRYKTYTFTFDERKQGEPLMMPVESPNHKYSAISYGIPYGGAAGGVDVKVEIIYKKTNTKKTIYYADYKQDFELQWLDNETLFIKNEDREYNDIKSIKLNIFQDIYDENGEACHSLVLKKHYKNCYQN